MDSEPIYHIRAHRRALHAKAQAEALGKFIQSFEELVERIRTGIVLASCLPVGEQFPIILAVNHSVMTAKPLFDVFRAIAATAWKRSRNDDQRSFLNTMIKNVATRFQYLCNMRNDLIHGTWGSSGMQIGKDDFEDLIVRKYKVTADGINLVKSLPTIKDLNTLIRECNAICDMIGCVGSSIPNYYYPNPAQSDDRLFIQKDGTWTPGMIGIRF